MKTPSLMALLVLFVSPIVFASNVSVVPTPNGGIQPQVNVDTNGTLHLVYFKGDPAHGNLFYVSRGKGEKEFSTPIQVNHLEGSAIAMGTIRGAQMSLGRNGRVHVAWMGSGQVAVKNSEDEYPQHPMLYTRLNEGMTAFELERNVVQWTKGIDGGGSVASDSFGNVFVTWHGSIPGNKQKESGRAMYVARSIDDGGSFLREVQANPMPTGSCGCCGMRAFVDDEEQLHLLYRAANLQSRDMTLLSSKDEGKTFSAVTINTWEIQACPMSSAAMASGNGKLLVATERSESVELATVKKLSSGVETVRMISQFNAKHPSIAINNNEEILGAWAEGAKWGKAGHLCWQKDGIEKVIGKEMKPWSFPTAVSLPNNDFIIFY